jgi:ABC-2 type transport system permease protein
MSALVRGELIKLRSTRTALGFATVALLLVLASVLVSLLAGEPFSIEDKRSALAFGGPLSIPLLVFGAVGATGEYRHRTLAPALLVAPGRPRLVLARTLAYAATGMAIGVAMLVVTFAIGIPLLSGADGPALDGGDYARLAVGGVLSAGLSSALGVGVGTLVRNQVGAVVGLLVYVFLVEPLILVLTDTASKYTVGQAQTALGGGSGSDLLPWGVALLVFAGWSAALVAAGGLVDARRDVV